MGTSAWEKNLVSRPALKIKDCHQPTSTSVIYQTPCDLGVIRNGGKRGAKHGPEALMFPFASLNAPAHKKFNFKTKSFRAESNNPDDFEIVQKSECQFFENELEGTTLLHLGGGHDHVYPFAKALATKSENLLVINVDAHLDTREDGVVHSGTPFRQLHKELGERMQLLQVGIHPFANPEGNYKDMGSMEILKSFSLEQIKSWLHKMKGQFKDATLLLSVDCDGLDASFMPAVSAPNHRGLSQEEFQGLFKVCQDYWHQAKTPRALGLYEFNPVYDNLSQQAARYLASYMYEFMVGEVYE